MTRTPEIAIYVHAQLECG